MTATTPGDAAGPVWSGRRDSTGLLVLQAPTMRNMLSEAMIAGIEEHMDVLESDPQVRGIVVIGRGASFCAGAPLGVLASSVTGDFALARRVYDAFLRIDSCPLPTVAAVNGPAVGAGFNLAMCCDVIVAAKGAWFQSRYPAMNLHPGGGHLWLLERWVGPAAARTIAMFDPRIDAERARDLGLAWEVCEGDILEEHALALASVLAARDRDYLATLKQSVSRNWSGMDYATAVDEEERAQRTSMAQPAFLQALARLQASIRG